MFLFLTLLICRGFIQPVNHVFGAQVEIKLVHVSTATVLGECEVTISITIEFQMAHCCGHVLDSVATCKRSTLAASVLNKQ